MIFPYVTDLIPSFRDLKDVPMQNSEEYSETVNVETGEILHKSSEEPEVKEKDEMYEIIKIDQAYGVGGG